MGLLERHGAERHIGLGGRIRGLLGTKDFGRKATGRELVFLHLHRGYQDQAGLKNGNLVASNRYIFPG